MHCWHPSGYVLQTRQRHKLRTQLTHFLCVNRKQFCSHIKIEFMCEHKITHKFINMANVVFRENFCPYHALTFSSVKFSFLFSYMENLLHSSSQRKSRQNPHINTNTTLSGNEWNIPILYWSHLKLLNTWNDCAITTSVVIDLFLSFFLHIYYFSLTCWLCHYASLNDLVDLIIFKITFKQPHHKTFEPHWVASAIFYFLSEINLVSFRFWT